MQNTDEAMPLSGAGDPSEGGRVDGRARGEAVNHAQARWTHGRSGKMHLGGRQAAEHKTSLASVAVDHAPPPTPIGEFWWKVGGCPAPSPGC